MNNVSIMAFDFGLKRIGVAIAHTETGTTHPLGVVRGRSNLEKMALVAGLVEEWKPDVLVVGQPRRTDGDVHELWPDLLRFAARLRALGAKPIYFADETFSSLEAENKLRQIDVRGRKAKPFLDTVAAQTILESVLLDAVALPYREGMLVEDLKEEPRVQADLQALGIGA